MCLSAGNIKFLHLTERPFLSILSVYVFNLKMMYHTLDTHEIIKSFISTGIKENQAEAIMKAISGTRETDLSNLATKRDLADVKVEIADVRGEISEVRGEISEVRGEIAEVRGEISEVRGEISEVRGEILKTESHLTIKMEETKSETMRWVTSVVIGATATSVAAIAGLIIFLFEHLTK